MDYNDYDINLLTNTNEINDPPLICHASPSHYPQEKSRMPVLRGCVAALISSSSVSMLFAFDSSFLTFLPFISFLVLFF